MSMNSPAPSSSPSAIPWPPLLLVAALGLGVLADRLYPLAWPGLDDLPARMVGYALGLAGIGLVVWGLITLSRAGTTVQPNRGADRLVTDGPFRWRRNPIYLGDVLILLGLAQLTYNIWFAILAPVFAIAVYWLAIRPEEQHLEGRFGQVYLDYKARTRRWF
ncbi:MAG TPA: isoprenylcysteine carboxylmethyltransferase family protein [Hyphomicrobiaceae bacterium]|nr:isoprenylcysteine carboxylmethyltransferase family protein [Hyphomicrobiaceae bacterium]